MSHRYRTLIINVPVVYMALGFNDFYEGKFITQAIGIGTGGIGKSRHFWEMIELMFTLYGAGRNNF
jgi:hypothetical protein